MPNVNNQHETHRVAVVPDLVLKRVVKYDKLSLDPLARLTGDSDPRSWRHHEAEMGTDPAVSWTGMRPDMNNWVHY